MKGLLGREKLSLPLDPYATATDGISPLSLRNFRANPAALRFAAGRDMLQNCSTVAPKFNPSPALGGSIGRDNLRLVHAFFRIKYTVIYSTTGNILNLSVIIAKSHHC